MTVKTRPATTAQAADDVALFRQGYADAKAGRPMAIAWGTGGHKGARYGMGYFHGRAHAPREVA